MNWFNDLKIRKKLLLSFGMLILFMIILTIYSAVHFFHIRDEYRNLTGATSKSQTDLADALGTLSMLRLNNISSAFPMTDNLISQSLLYLRSLDYEHLCDDFLKSLDNYLLHLKTDNNITPSTMQYYSGYIHEIKILFTEKFKPCYFKIRDGALESNKIKISEGLSEEYIAGTEITTLLNDLREMVIDYIGRESVRLTNYSEKIVYTQFFVAIDIILISIFVSLFMSRRIEKPISRLKNAATEIANGNLNYPIRSDGKDELGILSNYIGDMVDSLKKVTNAKSAFLANMSHEMRTPLNVVVGLTDLRLEDKDLPDKVQEDLKKINKAGELLLRLVNDVLDISKIEAGKFEIIPYNYNTADFINDVITVNIIRINERPIKFVVDISENLPSDLHGDELRLKQILNNLLNNAFKYTQEGSVTLCVECTSKDEKDTWLSVTINDTGIGIRQEDLDKIFSDYNLVDTKANRKIEGTGLGLPIAKRLIEMMDGKITVESEYGKGSSFRFNIKQGTVDNKTLGNDVVENLRNFRYTAIRQDAASVIVRTDLSYARVLVVDDFLTNLDVATGMLEKYKMKVDCITSGQEAVDLIKKGEPVYDAIFMDHMMPEMDGIEATKIIRDMDSEYARNMPIISLTANALAGNEKMFLENGFNAFLAKPINMLKLDIILKKLICKKSYADAKSKPQTETFDSKTVSLEQSHADDNQQKSGTPQFAFPPEINMEEGLGLYGGDMNIYKSILKSFAGNTPSIIEKLQNPTQESLPEYAINVHGLKSISAAIAAGDISQKARNLEILSKKGDLEGVLAENDEFIRKAELLLKNINNWLSN